MAKAVAFLERPDFKPKALAITGEALRASVTGSRSKESYTRRNGFTRVHRRPLHTRWFFIDTDFRAKLGEKIMCEKLERVKKGSCCIAAAAMCWCLLEADDCSKEIFSPIIKPLIMLSKCHIVKTPE